MFIGEAPGRLGADASGIPFHGDQAGHNFEELLEFAGISRSDVFITNAVLCNPKDKKGNNAPPRPAEIDNCSNHLRRQIELINPAIVVTLGSVALSAINAIEAHRLSLRSDVRSTTKWFGRVLIPLYHPGQRAMLHRSKANQRSDYQYVSEHLRKRHVKTDRANQPTTSNVAQVARALIERKPNISYFALHKLLYLVEYTSVRTHGHRATSAYFVRQKDGPYCVDLHLKRLMLAIPELSARTSAGKTVLRIDRAVNDLFSPAHKQPPIASHVADALDVVLKKWGHISDHKLKTAAYLTSPMRRLLKAELKSGLNTYNSPIDFKLA